MRVGLAGERRPQTVRLHAAVGSVRNLGRYAALMNRVTWASEYEAGRRRFLGG